MKLGDLLDRDLILPKLKAGTKKQVLAELVAAAVDKLPELDRDTAIEVLTERETLGTTGIGDGIAIPHGKLDNLENIVVVVGRSAGGVEYEALDQKPCHIFFLVLAPEQVAGMHLRVLAHISRLLKEDSFRKSFVEADTGDDLWRLLKGA
ncbi:PTS sugar transporter subunit IIA [Desulfovibrio ferrophilus]|uniref:PTS IIA-like nitrogen-regulatory protein PtsN n=1 Tax=Desulfovibrio ferrophilus TaxID=241368 RepID=A0A2Z6AWK0_9BACT|nr:PTS sugar transporter subunit IIA [Desulfovibrio ferrophilus]BBD07575.1 PTS IIA-like nitrogen-regulatory protein PtsN [Desulfovibrio ferrophilus]